jgi:hypothetical protein
MLRDVIDCVITSLCLTPNNISNYEIRLFISILYNKIVMEIDEIISAHVLFTDGTNSTRRWASVISCRRFHGKYLFGGAS